MKNVKTITLLATLVASTLSGPAMLANGNSLFNRIFSAETGKYLCKYIGIPASSLAIRAGINDLKFNQFLSRSQIAADKSMVYIGILGLLGSCIGSYYFAKHIKKSDVKSIFSSYASLVSDNQVKDLEQGTTETGIKYNYITDSEIKKNETDNDNSTVSNDTLVRNETNNDNSTVSDDTLVRNETNTDIFRDNLPGKPDMFFGNQGRNFYFK